jgi:tetratricopeptide (TPR) repeat protein
MAHIPSAQHSNPGSASGLFHRALALDEADDPRAKAVYLEAAASGDCTADAYCNLGLIELGDGNRAGAYDYYTRALQHNPRHFESHYNLACFYLESQSLDLAQLHLEICACLDPERSQVHLDLGVVLTLKEQYDVAYRHLVSFKQMAGEDGEAGVDALMNCVETLASAHRGLTVGN